MDKEQMRLFLRKRLVLLSQDKIKQKSKTASAKLLSLPEFQNADTVMIYLSVGTETDTSDIILAAWQHGKTVVAPKVSWEQRHMIPVEINSLDTGFSTDIAGLRNPIAGAPMPFAEIDFIVVPGLGFDRQGNRLGRGGGYFDRFFANKDLRAVKCGFAFDEQIIDSVPTSKSDKRVDILVTDKEVIHFNKEKES